MASPPCGFLKKAVTAIRRSKKVPDRRYGVLYAYSTVYYTYNQQKFCEQFIERHFWPISAR